MDESELYNLEQRVDELLRLVERLKEENRILRDHQRNLLAERARLTDKTEQARGKVEAMIARLRAMEQQAP